MMNLSELAGRLQGISQKLINAYNLNHQMQTRINQLEAQNASLQDQITQLQAADQDPVLPESAEQALNALDQSANSFAASQEQSQDSQPVVPPEAEQAVNALDQAAQAIQEDAQAAQAEPAPEQPA